MKRITLLSARGKSFAKVREVTNKGQWIQCKKGDLCIPLVIWEYMALCKNFVVKLRLKNGTRTDVPKAPPQKAVDMLEKRTTRNLG